MNHKLFFVDFFVMSTVPGRILKGKCTHALQEFSSRE